MAGSLVMGCSVWSYFQTVSTKQSAYAVMVIMGSGLSVMDVMALVFITEVIGENKVSAVKRISLFLETMKLNHLKGSFSDKPFIKQSKSWNYYKQTSVCKEILVLKKVESCALTNNPDNLALS